ncbi:MAG: hypothetical protein V4724_02465 [Pseudomonadota bacterium]
MAKLHVVHPAERLLNITFAVLQSYISMATSNKRSDALLFIIKLHGLRGAAPVPDSLLEEDAIAILRCERHGRGLFNPAGTCRRRHQSM